MCVVLPRPFSFTAFFVSLARLVGVCRYRLKLGWAFPGFARLCLSLLPFFVKFKNSLHETTEELVREFTII